MDSVKAEASLAYIAVNAMPRTACAVKFMQMLE